VCTTFNTFVCTQCSGVHREFSHRIKSISMAKFTSAEVSALQAGGNERAKSFFFRDVDIVRPESGSTEKLRDFIKKVYVERRYAADRPPKARQDEAALELRRPDPKVDTRRQSFEDHMGDRQSSGGRKSDVDRIQMESRGSPSTSTARPARHSYDERDAKLEERSPKDNSRERRALSRPFSFKDFDVTPPPAQSITELLGDVPGLRLEIYKHPNGNSPDFPRRSAGSSGDPRKSLQSQSFGAVGSDRVASVAQAHKRINSASLIDLNGEPAPAQKSHGVADPFAEDSQAVPTTSSSWATFNVVPTSPAPPGYPAPKSEASQWAATGWGQPTGAMGSWSSFGGSSPPPPPPQELPTQHTAVSPSEFHGSPRAEITQRSRREIPQNFFAPAIGSSLLAEEMHRRQSRGPVFSPPQLDPSMAAFYTPGGVPGDPQHVHNMQPQQQVQTQQQQLQPQSPHQQVLGRPQQQVQRGGNPFDDDEDEPTETHPADTSMQFPSMGPLQSALPHSFAGHPGVTSPSQSHGGPDWSLYPASSGNSYFDVNQAPSPYQMPSFSMQPDASGGYMSPHLYSQDAPYPSNQSYMQNVVRPAGGNPFE